MLDFNTIAGVSIPFVGTTLGAAMVFFMKDKIHPLLQKALLGFSSGVMTGRIRLVSADSRNGSVYRKRHGKVQLPPSNIRSSDRHLAPASL